MDWLIWVAIWFVCGFVAYGMLKGYLKCLWETGYYGRHDIEAELVCLAFAIFGLFGLGAALLVALLDQKLWFCLKMPMELKRRHNERI